MNARDELSNLIWATETEQLGTFKVGPTSEAADKIADAILAAGYRKPRTITTAEELDALPNGSVVLSAIYIHHHGQAISFQRWEDGLWHRGARCGDTHPDNFLPATVLYEPGDAL